MSTSKDASESKTVAFLRSLNSEEAIKLWEYVEQRAKLVDAHATNLPADLYMYESLGDGLSGAEWRAWACCHNVTSFGQNPPTIYPRFQVNFTVSDKRHVFTPEAKKTGPSPVGLEIKNLFSEPSWEAFKALAEGESKEGATPRSKKIARLGTHHLAYNAKVARAKSAGIDLEPLPLDVGSGSSVSHLCDNPKCANPAHLEVALAHRDNMARQRCSGVTLVVVSGVIIEVDHCPHYEVDEEDGVISPDCAVLKVINLTGLVEVSELFRPAFKEAHAKFAAAKLVAQSPKKRGRLVY